MFEEGIDVSVYMRGCFFQKKANTIGRGTIELRDYVVIITSALWRFLVTKHERRTSLSLNAIQQVPQA